MPAPPKTAYRLADLANFGQLSKRSQVLGQSHRNEPALSFSTSTVAGFSDVYLSRKYSLNRIQSENLANTV